MEEEKEVMAGLDARKNETEQALAMVECSIQSLLWRLSRSSAPAQLGDPSILYTSVLVL